MKIFALKYRILLIIISVSFLAIDVFLMNSYGFDAEWLILLYVLIGVIPLCGVLTLCSNMAVPSVTFNYHSKTIITDFVANELYKYDRSFINQGDKFYFDEITNCKINKKKIQLTLKYGYVKTLYLGFFTKGQIRKIQKEIEKIICNNKM